MTKVVVENKAAHSQRTSRIGGSDQRWYRGELITQVVRYQQRRVTQCFSLAGDAYPLFPGFASMDRNAETKWSMFSHERLLLDPLKRIENREKNGSRPTIISLREEHLCSGHLFQSFSV